MYLNILIDYAQYYGNTSYNLDISIPLSLLNYLVEDGYTEEIHEKQLFTKEISLGEIEGKHSDIVTGINYELCNEYKGFDYTHEDMYDNLMENLLEDIELTEEAEECEAEFVKELCKKYTIQYSGKELKELIEIISKKEGKSNV